MRSVREETVSLAVTTTLTCTNGTPAFSQDPVMDCVTLIAQPEAPEVEEVDDVEVDEDEVDEEVEVDVDAE